MPASSAAHQLLQDGALGTGFDQGHGVLQWLEKDDVWPLPKICAGRRKPCEKMASGSLAVIDQQPVQLAAQTGQRATWPHRSCRDAGPTPGRPPLPADQRSLLLKRGPNARRELRPQTLERPCTRCRRYSTSSRAPGVVAGEVGHRRAGDRHRTAAPFAPFVQRDGAQPVRKLRRGS